MGGFNESPGGLCITGPLNVDEGSREASGYSAWRLNPTGHGVGSKEPTAKE